MPVEIATLALGIDATAAQQGAQQAVTAVERVGAATQGMVGQVRQGEQALRTMADQQLRTAATTRTLLDRMNGVSGGISAFRRIGELSTEVTRVDISISSLAGTIGNFVPLLVGAGRALLATPWGLAIAGASALLGVLSGLGDEQERVSKASSELAERTKDLTDEQARQVAIAERQAAALKAVAEEQNRLRENARASDLGIQTDVVLGLAERTLGEQGIGLVLDQIGTRARERIEEIRADLADVVIDGFVGDDEVQRLAERFESLRQVLVESSTSAGDAAGAVIQQQFIEPLLRIPILTDEAVAAVRAGVSEAQGLARGRAGVQQRILDPIEDPEPAFAPNAPLAGGPLDRGFQLREENDILGDQARVLGEVEAIESRIATVGRLQTDAQKEKALELKAFLADIETEARLVGLTAEAREREVTLLRASALAAGAYGAGTKQASDAIQQASERLAIVAQRQAEVAAQAEREARARQFSNTVGRTAAGAIETTIFEGPQALDPAAITRQLYSGIITPLITDFISDQLFDSLTTETVNVQAGTVNLNAAAVSGGGVGLAPAGGAAPGAGVNLPTGTSQTGAGTVQASTAGVAYTPPLGSATSLSYSQGGGFGVNVGLTDIFGAAKGLYGLFSGTPSTLDQTAAINAAIPGSGNQVLTGGGGFGQAINISAGGGSESAGAILAARGISGGIVGFDETGTITGLLQGSTTATLGSDAGSLAGSISSSPAAGLGSTAGGDLALSFGRQIPIASDLFAPLEDTLLGFWRPIADAVLGFTGGGFARGGVFSRGSIVPFHSGGVIDEPTFFPLRGGRVGLAGEDGDEAIMPLRRGRDGRLGVEFGGRGRRGGGVTINVTTPDADSFRRAERHIMAAARRRQRLGGA